MTEWFLFVVEDVVSAAFWSKGDAEDVINRFLGDSLSMDVIPVEVPFSKDVTKAWAVAVIESDFGEPATDVIGVYATEDEAYDHSRPGFTIYPVWVFDGRCPCVVATVMVR